MRDIVQYNFYIFILHDLCYTNQTCLCSRWCGPCRALEPRLENVVAKHNGKITLAKVDVDSLGEVAAKYEVAMVLINIRSAKYVNF